MLNNHIIIYSVSYLLCQLDEKGISLFLRYVDPLRPLAPYDWLDSYCRLLHHDAADGALRREAFLGGLQLSGVAGLFAVVTESSLVVLDTSGASEAKNAKVGGWVDKGSK